MESLPEPSGALPAAANDAVVSQPEVALTSKQPEVPRVPAEGEMVVDQVVNAPSRPENGNVSVNVVVSVASGVEPPQTLDGTVGTLLPPQNGANGDEVAEHVQPGEGGGDIDVDEDEEDEESDGDEDESSDISDGNDLKVCITNLF